MALAGPCDGQSEEAAFRTNCGAQIVEWDAARRSWEGRRGLVVRWHLEKGARSAGAHGYGAGHLLELLFRVLDEPARPALPWSCPPPPPPRPQALPPIMRVAEED